MEITEFCQAYETQLAVQPLNDFAKSSPVIFLLHLSHHADLSLLCLFSSGRHLVNALQAHKL